MSSKPGDHDFSAFRGLEATAVDELVHEGGAVGALQIVLADGSSVVLTVWTDWTLRIERMPGSGMPDYLWPPEAFFRRPILAKTPGELRSLVTGVNEVGETSSADLEIGSFGGALLITAT